MANATWNPADNSGMTLSGSNLTATSASASSGVRASAGQNAGKFYWEVRMTTWAGASCAPGVANASAVLTAISSSVANASIVLKSGAIFYNGSSTGLALGARAANDTIGLALDMDNKRLWFRVAPAGNWNGSGTANPGTNVGGIDVSTISTSSALLYPSYSTTSGTGDAATANFGDSAFSGAVPSGFTAGVPVGGGGSGGAASIRVAVMA